MSLVSRFSTKLTPLSLVIRRNFGISSVVAAKATETGDPIQKLFLDKLKEYNTKSAKLKEGELFDSSPEIEARRKFEEGNLNRRYGGGNMEEFPKFSFQK